MVVCAISWKVVTVFEEKSRAALHYNLWVRQVVISWLDTQWWYLMMMMMANSLELLVQVEHSAPPSSSSICQISTVSIIILFCLKLWLIKAFAFLYFLAATTLKFLYLGGGVQIERLKSPFIMVHSKLNDCIFGDESSDQSWITVALDKNCICKTNCSQ